MKQHGGVMLLTGDPGIGKTVALRRFVDGLNDNIYRLILAGQSELRQIMHYAITEPVARRLRLRNHMPRLSAEETAAYVERLLQRAGAREGIFATEALSAIHELTFGIPRPIGSMASQGMLYAIFKNKRTVDADMVLKVKTGAY